MDTETFTPLITTDISAIPKTLESNLDELAPYVTKWCEFARSLIVDADNMADCDNAKKEAATIAKIEKAIAEKRKEWTRTWAAPLEAIVEKCKKYELDLHNAAALLRTNAAQGEAKIKSRKRDRLRDIWAERVEHSGMDKALRHFADYFAANTNEATVGNWLNKGATDAKILAAMDAELERCKHETEVVEGLFADSPVEVRTIALDALHLNFSATEAAEAVTRFREQQKRLEEQRKAEEERLAEAKRQKEETEREKAEAESAKSAPPPAATAPATPTPTIDEPVVSFSCLLTGKRSNLTKMRIYGESLGITFKAL